MPELPPRSDRDIAVVGLAVGAPGGFSVGSFWSNLSEGADLITEVPPEIIEPFYFGAKDNSQVDRFYNNRGGFTDRIVTDPLRYGLLPIAADGADPDQLVSLMLTDFALADAGMLGQDLTRSCVIVGRGQFAGLPQLISSEMVRTAESLTRILKAALPLLPDEAIDKIKKDYQSRFGRYQGDTVTANMPNLVAAGVAHRYDIHGPAYVVDAACASGVVALEHGIRLIQVGECDSAVIGAMHTGQNSVFWSAFNVMGAMSKRGVIAPFSQDADGLLIGQGAGFLVIKSLEQAEKDGNRIYAVIKATATGSDGAGTNALVTNPAGQRRVLEEAWRKCGLDPEQVGYVETHGTATQIGDANELQTLTEFFGDATHPRAYLGSVKSNIGHTMPAAGMFGLIKTILALFHRQIPPTLHCEKPLTAMAKSRFEPAQELIDWEEAGLPLVAGVNAFGFGGANAHAVLTAYQEPAAQARRYRVDRRRQYFPDVIALAGKTKEDLLSVIDMKHATSHIGSFLGQPGDPYRIVVFNPTAERLALACDIIRADKPWRGRSDIWFTNQPLLRDGGKTVFMFPGYSLTGEAERDSVVDELDIPYTDFPTDDPVIHDAAAEYYTCLLLHEALLKTGITPDLYTGHSVGEWFAARAIGVLDESFDRLVLDFAEDPNLQIDPDEVPDFKLVAIASEIDPAVRQRLLAVPGVTLSNDNCPSQIVISVLGPESLDLVKGILDEAKAFYTVLPFASALHTPYIEQVMDVPILAMRQVATHPSPYPLWSAVTLDQLDTTQAADSAGAAEVFAAELSQPVRYRELIEKLYAEQDARVFIQVGPGPLTGFVDDTLKGREFASIGTTTPGRVSLDQLRRVHAVLYTEGSPMADIAFVGMRAEFREAKSVYYIPQGAPLLQDLQSLDEAVEQYYGPAAAAGASAAGLGLEDLGDLSNPLVEALDDNVRQAIQLQHDVVRRFRDRGLLATATAGPAAIRGGGRTATLATAPAPPAAAQAVGSGTVATQAVGSGTVATELATATGPDTAAAPDTDTTTRKNRLTTWRTDAKRAEGMDWTSSEQLGSRASAIADFRAGAKKSTVTPEQAAQAMAGLRAAKHRRGQRIEVPLVIDIRDYPLTYDHSIVRQPRGWEEFRPKEVYPIVPLTMSLELMVELARQQIPESYHPVRLGPITAMNFMSLNEPFEAAVKCFWKSDVQVSLTIEGYLMMDVTFAETYPEPPAGYRAELEAQLGEDAGPLFSPKETYADFAFHREAYHSSVAMTRNAVRGMEGQVRKAAGKGSLLDQIGQAIGLFLHLHEKDNRVSFPVRVAEIKFYGDMFDQDGTFDACLFVKGLTDNFITGEGIYERDGQTWLTYRGWVNQRLSFDEAIWDVVMRPERSVMSEEVAPGVFYVVNRNPNQQAIIFVALRYLTWDENMVLEDIESWDGKCAFTWGRVALKDAVRRALWPADAMPYPVAITTRYDEAGRVYVTDREGLPLREGLDVSLAHKTDRAAAIVADRPVGLDLERIEERNQGFLDLAFNPAELELLAEQGDQAEWATRFWVAKEAYAKMTGEGLRGNPRRFSVEAVDGEVLSVAGTRVVTRRLEDDHIVGWTI
ncbi:MAG: 4'-phosphopantetheinyl transferase superfamily protein [Propionibacteriaceae bacterium]|jgi:acyl transferase domain-containing protein/phosphopantetheinyl transferase|nr:4'-phosphopantetheinyl transferase superfamily protein [Propionibacteriaceae bacterium]